jgi:hypothetical protein
MLHALQNFRGVILLSLSVEGELRIQTDRKYSARNAKRFFNRRTKILQQPFVDIPDRQQMQ